MTDPSAGAQPDRLVTYRPGSWFGIFGDHADVLLPPTEKRRVAALWEIVDDGAGFAEVLDALIAGGLRDLPAFVLVSTVGGTTQVVLRGPAAARLTAAGDTVDLDGAGVATWVERTLGGVTAMTFELEQAAAYAEVELTTAGGVARVGRVQRDVGPTTRLPAPPAATAAATGDPADVETGRETGQERGPEADDVAADGGPTPSEDIPWEGQETEAFAAVGAPVGSDGLDDAGLDEGPGPGIGEGAADDPVPGSSHPGGYTDVAGGPVPAVSGRAGSYTDSWPSPAATGTRDDSDAPTRVGTEALATSTGPVLRLDFSHGESVEVDRVIIVGRAPEARRFSLAAQPRLITVPSPHQEISSTHLEVRPGSGDDAGTALVTDLGSTNGTVLVGPDGASSELESGVSVPLLPGATVDLGDGLTLTATLS